MHGTEHIDHTLGRRIDQVITHLDNERDPIIRRWMRWVQAIYERDIPAYYGRERGER